MHVKINQAVNGPKIIITIKNFQFKVEKNKNKKKNTESIRKKILL